MLAVAGAIGCGLPIEDLVLDQVPCFGLHVANLGVDQLLHVGIDGGPVLIDDRGDAAVGDARLIVG